ncbi:MAG TPA: heavy metal-binding domain-containing protein [Sphingobacteriaceae bacterium]|nr:heavy metal-binding domain-containing protein [Sphingobacteriaceae bacterium]
MKIFNFIGLVIAFIASSSSTFAQQSNTNSGLFLSSQNYLSNRVSYPANSGNKKNGIHLQEQTFSCPMHPEVKTNKRGNCPKCGMKLVKKAPEKMTYACPMHPEVTSKDFGKCTKCGMSLVKGKQLKSRDVKASEEMDMYSCPMHPNEGSKEPGKCADCGMKMVKKNK